jgi:PAS domain S-box-containing protein
MPVELTVGRSDKAGSPLLVCVLRDESARRSAERRIDFQGALLDQVRLAVVGATADGRLAYANATAVAIFGIRPESMGNLLLANLLFDSGHARDYVEVLKRSGSISREMELRDAGGARFPALVNVTHLFGRDGESLGFAGVAIDITDRRRTEERLAALLASKDEFVTSVSHELRTPLTVILGMAEELERDFDQFQSEDLRSLLALIADQSRDLASIVQDLLVIGRADAGGSLVINATRVDLATELKAAADLYLAGGAKLEVNVRAPIWADTGRFRQVVRNLLTNAVRYGGPSVRIAAREEGDTTLITVADDGPGVPPEEAERIFEPYMRSAKGAALPASMGLGLAVARKLSLLMGGDLTYSRQGAWTVFCLRLPNCPDPINPD